MKVYWSPMNRSLRIARTDRHFRPQFQRTWNFSRFLQKHPEHAEMLARQAARVLENMSISNDAHAFQTVGDQMNHARRVALKHKETRERTNPSTNAEGAEGASPNGPSATRR